MKAAKYSCSILLLLSLVFTGCNMLNSDVAGPLQIRVANHSSQTMQNTLVTFPESDVKYGTINAGEATTYESIEQAYRYAYIEVMVDGRKLILQPIDYVGERQLEPGKYTYQLTINEEAYMDESNPYALLLTLKKD